MSEDKKCTCEFQCDSCSCKENDSVTMEYTCDVCDSAVTSTAGEVVDIRIFTVKEVITDNANKISSTKHFGDFTISPYFKDPDATNGFDGVTIRRIVPTKEAPAVMMLDIKNIENKTIKTVFEDCPWVTAVMIAEVYRIFDKYTDKDVNTALSSKTKAKNHTFCIDKDMAAFSASFPLHGYASKNIITPKKPDSKWTVEIVNPEAAIYTGMKRYLEANIVIVDNGEPSNMQQLTHQLMKINADLMHMNLYPSWSTSAHHHQIRLVSFSASEKILRVFIETIPAAFSSNGFSNFTYRNPFDSESMWESLTKRFAGNGPFGHTKF